MRQHRSTEDRPHMTSSERIRTIYDSLLDHYGPQGWWPAETPFECILGSILTQNTAWTNVEKAIGNLRLAGLLSPRALHAVPTDLLAHHIRPSGYFNQKALRIKGFLSHLAREHGGDLEEMLSQPADALRRELLGITGIGPETADSITLYAARLPVFVVDTYTARILGRHGLVGEGAFYTEVQELFERSLAPDTDLFGEYHALLVRTGKEHCRKRSPLCEGCPLEHDPHSV